MKSKMRFLAILVVAVFCLGLLLAGCANVKTPSSSPSNTPAGTKPATQPAEEEISNIIMSFTSNTPEEVGRIEAAINKITEPEIGVHLNLVVWEIGSYLSNFSLAITGGEVIDIVRVSPINPLATMIAQKQIMEVNDLFTTYASGALEVCGSFADAYRSNGGLYGLPTYRLLQNNGYAILRKDILQECGVLDIAENCKTWSDLETIFDAVNGYCKENHMYVIGGAKYLMTPKYLCGDGENFDKGYVSPGIGENTALVRLEDNKATLSWEDPIMVQFCKRFNSWNEKGWVWPETPYNDDHVDTLMKNSVVFGYLDDSEFGVEKAKLNSTGYEVVAPQFATGSIASESLTMFGVAVGITSANPVGAAKFINMMYTDARICNLFAWGEEGVDYTINSEGEMIYPGNDIKNAKYRGADYALGNQFLCLPTQGQGGDFRTVAKAVNDAAPVSEYMGFLINPDGLDTLIASLSAVKDEYQVSLVCGLYTDDLYNEFITKLNNVGMQDYLTEVQKQLDAFLAKK